MAEFKARLEVSFRARNFHYAQQRLEAVKTLLARHGYEWSEIHLKSLPGQSQSLTPPSGRYSGESGGLPSSDPPQTSTKERDA